MTLTPRITTTAGKVFTGRDSELLAALVLRRFGYDTGAAAAAWRRMLGNSCSDEQFAEMASYGRLDARTRKDK
jgi:hypothetical protein